MSLPLAEEELVARSNPRLAAGVGVVSAFLLLGGPGLAVAIADPDGSGGSDGGNSSVRDWGESRRGPGGGADNRDGDSGSRGGNDSRAPDSGNEPWTRVGSGRGDVQELSPGDRSGPNDAWGSDQSGAPSPKFEPPKVTVGNGRSPGVRDNDREPRWRIPAPEPAPPPPPPAPPAPAPSPSWVDRVYTPPTLRKQLGVTPASKVTDPLWGVAGLLLIPAAGAVLGYRQARAAQDADKLRRA
jgi:hypothetical protein